jgi:hypothetical protein
MKILKAFIIVLLCTNVTWAQNKEETARMRRIAKGQGPKAKGLYIVNGKKVMY